MGYVLGVDFGTTNTVVAWRAEDGSQGIVPFKIPGGETTAFRSVLSFRETPDPVHPRMAQAGPWAIEDYLEDPLDTRFIQSFKSFAASPHFQSTDIFQRRYRFEDLLAAFLTQISLHGGTALQGRGETVVVGRPVQFAGVSPSARLALERYEAAFLKVGFKNLRYVYEPVGAAFYFAQSLSGPATVLVADFGGGTSDFSIIRFQGAKGRGAARALANAGVPVAGDDFDYRIIDHVVSPELGKGSTYRSQGKILPVPNRYFSAFARWSQLAMLKTSRDLSELKSLARTASDQRLSAFVDLIEGDHGYPLYRAVSLTKQALSTGEAARFSFHAAGVDIEADIARSDFESWIKPELTQMERACETALAAAGLTAPDIDQVFLTGGSSLVPAVRRLFVDRFGAHKIAAGGEFESIASGLATIGGSGDHGLWSERLAPDC